MVERLAQLVLHKDPDRWPQLDPDDSFLLSKGGPLSSELATSLPWWRRGRRRFYHRLLVSVLWGAERISLENGRRLGRFLARIGARLRPEDRQRALSNLARAFPELDSQARQNIFDASVPALGENFHDTLAAPALLRLGQLVQEEDHGDGPGLMQELQKLSQGGRGVLILTGHLGCWELLGGWLAASVSRAGLGQLAVVTGSIHNEPVDQLVQERRRSLGMKVLARSGGAVPLLRHLQSGGVAAVLLDQNTRVENLPIPFFGQEAPTPVGFARIVLRYGIPVLPVVLARKGQGHEVRRGIAWLPEESGGDDADALADLLLWCNRSLEKFIRRNPAEWVWFHQRWPERNQSPPL